MSSKHSPEKQQKKGRIDIAGMSTTPITPRWQRALALRAHGIEKQLRPGCRADSLACWPPDYPDLPGFSSAAEKLIAAVGLEP